jgi:hypothetical protein
MTEAAEADGGDEERQGRGDRGEALQPPGSGA